MPLKDSQESPMASRRLPAIGFIAFLVSGALLFAFVNRQQTTDTYNPGSLPAQTATTEAKSTEHDEILSRLREILRVREDAYRFRNPEMLRSIYSEDCPCLASDQNAIDELLRLEHRWTGIATSIEVRSVKRIDERIWVVVALFRSNALRVETRSGGLVRLEPAGNDLFQFTLVKPQDTQQWLLGMVTELEANK
jgi:hypothetical protein